MYFEKNTMRVENNYSPHFGAKLINQVKLHKWNGHSYIPVDGYFLQLNPKISDDFQAIENISKSWKSSEYVKNIINMAKIKKDSDKYTYINIYALTNKYDEFKKIDSNSILGVAQVCDLRNKNSANLEYLQTNPKFLYERKKIYKGIGRNIVNSIKELFDKISLIPADSKYVFDFYIKNGFHYNSGMFFWTKKI